MCMLVFLLIIREAQNVCVEILMGTVVTTYLTLTAGKFNRLSVVKELL